MYKANVYSVMIASPGDVMEEREIARRLIHEWNDLHSRETGMVILPLLWEYSTTPASGDRAQALINAQMLEDADLLVGIFWARIGTNTGKAISGTVEEINIHIENGKPAMLYFSDRPVKPSLLKSEQYEAVQSLKEQYRESNLYSVFDSSQSFENQFRTHLILKLNNKVLFQRYSGSGMASVGIESMPVVQGRDEIDNVSITLLRLASRAKDGSILFAEGKTGIAIQIDNRNVISNNTAKEVAKWEGALDTLEKKQLIRKVSPSVYKVTSHGFDLIDEMFPKYSEPINKLISHAAKSREGRIVIHESGKRWFLLADSSHIIENQEPRTVAKYKDAIQDAVKFGLLTFSDTGKALEISEKGYDYYDEVLKETH
jgi:hypothetical protein